MDVKNLFSAKKIATRVTQLGKEIAKTYKNADLVIIGVLKGCFMFLSDLVRVIDLPVAIDFARLASYGDSDSPTGKVQILKDIEINIAKSVKICVFIDKTLRREAHIKPDFLGFSISEGFVVGYGLDYAERYRNLPGIYVIESNEGNNP